MIEDLVKTMADEKMRLKNKCQENVKFAIQLREAEDKIKELQEELRKQRALNESTNSTHAAEIEPNEKLEVCTMDEVGGASIDQMEQNISEDNSENVVTESGVDSNGSNDGSNVGLAMMKKDFAVYNKQENIMMMKIL